MTCGAIGTVGTIRGLCHHRASKQTPLRPEFGDCEDCGDKVLFPCSYSGDCVYSMLASHADMPSAQSYQA
jgi:hypothetical protein